MPARRAVTPRTRRRAPMSPPPTPSVAPRPPPLPRLPFLRALSSSASLVGASRAPRLAGPSRCIAPPWAPRRFHAWQRGSRTTPARHVTTAGVRSEGTTIAAKCPCAPEGLTPRRLGCASSPSACPLRPKPCQPRVRRVPHRTSACFRDSARPCLSFSAGGRECVRGRQRTLLGFVDFPASFAGSVRRFCWKATGRPPSAKPANKFAKSARRFCPSSSRGFCLLSRVFLTY